MISRLRRLDPATLRAAFWTLRAVISVRRRLSHGGLEAVKLPPVPSLPVHAQRGVAAVLRRLRSTCLERSAVLQAWHAARGDERDLIIGVTAPEKGFRAHAWLEGDPPCQGEGFRELLRRPAPR